MEPTKNTSYINSSALLNTLLSYIIMSDDTWTSKECADGDVASRTGCILSYDGNTTDIILNYTLLGLNLIWCIIALCFHTTDIEKKNKLRRFAIGSLLFGTSELISRLCIMQQHFTLTWSQSQLRVLP